MEKPSQPESELPFSTAVLQRRNFLRMGALLTGGSLLLGPSEAFGFLFFPKHFSSSPATKGGAGAVIPKEWVEVLGKEAISYAHYLSQLQLRRIRVEQIIKPHLRRRGNVQNRIPPRSAWKNIRASLRAADRIAERLGEPVGEIISAYRSPQYNARCSGARSKSFHMHNMALDLKFRASPRQVAMVAREMREKGVFSGGVGRYSGFTHIDSRGKKADW